MHMIIFIKIKYAVIAGFHWRRFNWFYLRKYK